MMIILVLVLSFIVGFASRRTNMCMVIATRELLEGRQHGTSLAIAGMMAVAVLITVTAAALFPEFVKLTPSYGLSLALIFGGLLYGFGAAVNGACLLGTLNGLAGGNVNYLGTILGVVAGFCVFLVAADQLMLMRPTQHVASGTITGLIYTLFLVVWVCAILISRRLQRAVHELEPWSLTATVRAQLFPILSFGIGAGMLFLVIGHSWGYSRLLIGLDLYLFGVSLPREEIEAIIVTSVGFTLGIILATVISRTFKGGSIRLGSIAKKFLGGTIMGFGAGLIPGANDSLILHGLPGFAFHAPIAATLIVVGITTTLVLGKRRH